MDDKIDHIGLTDVECRVLGMIIGNMSDCEIAFALDISDIELSECVRKLLIKLDAPDRASAAAIAIQQGLVRIEL